jgi:3-hydroxypropanoate dehydrogenase
MTKSIAEQMDALPGAANEDALDQMFRLARTHNGWLDRKVPDQLLRKAVDLAKMGPTSANTLPMRVIFVTTPEGKAKLQPAILPQNVEKMLTAPTTAIVGYDLNFPETLPRLFPHADARSWFVGNAPLIADTAFRNGSLQGGYLILALRALGLDVGPMSGFDASAVDKEFFAGTDVRTNFLLNIGFGDVAKIFERSPRPQFEEIARFV